MAYTRVNWEDLPSTNTPRNATNLNKMDAGIKENDDKLNGTKAMGSIVVDDVNCKNLLSSFMELGSLNNDTGATATSTDAIRTANFVEVEPNTTYTVSNDKQYHIYVYEYSSASSSGFIKYTGANTDAYKSKSTITTTSTTKYIKIRTVVSNVENDLTSKWQLEKGSEATSYTEYKPIGKEIYSTVETKIGIFDGKPLYRIVVNTTSPSAIDTSTSIHTVSNINVTKIDGMLHYSSNVEIPLNFYQDATHSVATYKSSGSNISMRVTASSYTNKDVTLILEYTKTND